MFSGKISQFMESASFIQKVRRPRQPQSVCKGPVMCLRESADHRRRALWSPSSYRVPAPWSQSRKCFVIISMTKGVTAGGEPHVRDLSKVRPRNRRVPRD